MAIISFLIINLFRYNYYWAGIPLRKFGHFRELLEENAMRLTDRRHMSNLITFVLKEEQQRIKQEISSEFVSVIFDGRHF